MTTTTRKPVSIAIQIGALQTRLRELMQRRNELWLERDKSNEWLLITEEITDIYKQLRSLRKLTK